MPFNKISLLSVEDTSISTIHIPHIQDLQSTTAQDGNDIFYHLGTWAKLRSLIQMEDRT